MWRACLFAQIRSVRDQLHQVTAAGTWPGDQRELYFILGGLSSLLATAAQHAGCPADAEELAPAGLAAAIG